MRMLLVLILVLYTANCNKQSYLRNSCKSSDKQELVNEIRQKTAIKIMKKHHLRPFGTAGQMLGQIKMIGLSFQYDKPIDIEEGRKLLIAAANELLAEINGNEDVRPYLDQYPFEPKNILIEIFLRNPDGSDPLLGNLVLVEVEEGLLSYKIDNSETNLFTTIFKETFEEALLKIQSTH